MDRTDFIAAQIIGNGAGDIFVHQEQAAAQTGGQGRAGYGVGKSPAAGDEDAVQIGAKVLGQGH